MILALTLPMSGCLGTIVTAPGSKGKTYKSTDVHFVLLPAAVNAGDCNNGIKEVSVSTPVWGAVVGYLTFGIIIPVNTLVTCKG
jgi:hypothetical protein